MAALELVISALGVKIPASDMLAVNTWSHCIAAHKRTLRHCSLTERFTLGALEDGGQ